MDVNRSQVHRQLRAQDIYREAMVDHVRRTRSRVHEARAEGLEKTARRPQPQQAGPQADTSPVGPERDRKDRIDISEQLHARVQAARIDAASEEAKRPVLQRLQHAYRTGKLNTPERVERAAENMLNGLEAPPEKAERGIQLNDSFLQD